MRRLVGLIASACVVLTATYAAEWSGAWKPLKATYTIYSGELAEREAPTSTERTMTIAIEGAAAKEIFDSIGPDIRQGCSQAKGYHERLKKGVSCTYESQASSKAYRCWIGLNLRTGESIPTVSC